METPRKLAIDMWVKRLRTALVFLVVFVVSGCWEDDFVCQDEGRRLSDAEFLDIAFAYEVSEKDLPEPYLSLGINGIRDIDSSCCFVERETSDWNRRRGLLARLLSDPSVLVVIRWAQDPERFATNRTSYTMSLCGRVIERWGSFRLRE